jgi:uncharacterized protein
MSDFAQSAAPVPARRDQESSVWFDHLAHGRLLIRQCRRCMHHSRHDLHTCPACHSDDLAWHVASGAGTVVSVVVDHGRDERVGLCLVELDEGPWLHARLTDLPRAAAGDRVRLTVLFAHGSEPIPSFTHD